MSVYRSVVGRHGVSIPARTTAKVKTLLQDVAIGLCLAPPLAGHQGVLSAGDLGGHGHDPVHRRPVLPRRPAGRPAERGGDAGHRRSARRRHQLGGLSRRAHRDRRRRDRAAPRPDRRHQLRSGWASTWPPPGSPPTSTRRWATTTSGWCWPSGRPWPAATGSSSAGASGPTHDDITREAIAEVMNVPSAPGRRAWWRRSGPCSRAGAGRCPTPTSDRPTCPRAPPSSPRPRAPLPGSSARSGHKVIYAVPGVPYEMSDMFERAIVPDLQRRMAERGETAGVIASRVIRTWGMSESGLAEALAGHIDHLDAPLGGDAGGGRPVRTGRPPSPSWPAASRGSRCGSR